MIERHISFKVDLAKADAFERFFAELYRPPMSQSPGFVRADLLRAPEDPTRYQMTLRWQDTEAATAWRTSSVHQSLQPELAALAETGGIQVYDVVG